MSALNVANLRQLGGRTRGEDLVLGSHIGLEHLRHRFAHDVAGPDHLVAGAHVGASFASCFRTNHDKLRQAARKLIPEEEQCGGFLKRHAQSVGDPCLKDCAWMSKCAAIASFELLASAAIHPQAQRNKKDRACVVADGGRTTAPFLADAQANE